MVFKFRAIFGSQEACRMRPSQLGPGAVCQTQTQADCPSEPVRNCWPCLPVRADLQISDGLAWAIRESCGCSSGIEHISLRAPTAATLMRVRTHAASSNLDGNGGRCHFGALELDSSRLILAILAHQARCNAGFAPRFGVRRYGKTPSTQEDSIDKAFLGDDLVACMSRSRPPVDAATFSPSSPFVATRAGFANAPWQHCVIWARSATHWKR